MKSLLLAGTFFVLTSLPNSSYSEPIIRIDVGSTAGSSSNQELQKRVHDLERAVIQLQKRVFELEDVKAKPLTSDSWICYATAMGETFTGTGGSKPVASNNATEACAKTKDRFFCKIERCEQ